MSLTNTIHFKNLQGDLFGGVTAAIVIMVILTTFLLPSRHKITDLFLFFLRVLASNVCPLLFERLRQRERAFAVHSNRYSSSGKGVAPLLLRFTFKQSSEEKESLEEANLIR